MESTDPFSTPRKTMGPPAQVGSRRPEVVSPTKKKKKRGVATIETQANNATRQVKSGGGAEGAGIAHHTTKRSPSARNLEKGLSVQDAGRSQKGCGRPDTGGGRPEARGGSLLTACEEKKKPTAKPTAAGIDGSQKR